MASHHLFLCYSRKDATSRDRLLAHLDPYQREEKLEVWFDRKTEAGDPWESKIFEEIDRAMVAVVLVSPDLLASSFVMDKELPRLFRARKDRGLLLTSLFVRESNFDVPKIKVGDERYSLAELQGLNDPKEPLESSDAGDAILQRAAEELCRALDGRGKEEPRRGGPRQRIQISLRRRNGKIFRRSGLPPYFDVHSSQGDYPERRLKSLDPSDDAYGRLLFEVLLGGEEEQLQALSKALGRELGSPDRHAFRARILCHDEALRQLPWSLCRSRSGALVDAGWTFELASSSDPPVPSELHSPSPALYAAAEVEGMPELHTARHGQAFEGLLKRAWAFPLKRELLQRVSGREALKTALAKSPRLIYLYAHAREVSTGVELLLGEGGTVEPLPLAELAEWLKAHPPQVLVLNTPEDVGPAPIFERVHVCLQLRGESNPWQTRQHALDWWQEVLLLDQDPARAFCALPSGARRRALLVGRYGEWKHLHHDYTPRVDRARAHLDRRDQRRVVREAVEQLVRSPTRRLTCLVAYGAEENLVENFAVQLASTLKTQAYDLAHLIPHDLTLPAEREALDRTAIRDAFREQMRLQPPDDLEDAFGHTVRGPRAKPVHFFDWGTYPSHERGPKLTSANLETWITFCRDELANACPKTTQALAYISLETATENHPRLKTWLDSLVTLYNSRHFTLVPVPALGVVETNDLLHFLTDPNNSSCPEPLQRSLSARIVAKTGGSFEATVELLEETERGDRWFELDEELPEVDTEPASEEPFVL